MKRNFGADLFRILCCFGVLGSHIVDDALSSQFSAFIYYACIFCAPGFFMLSGYLLAERKEHRIDYFEKKAAVTLAKLVGWIALYLFCIYAFTGIKSNLWIEVISSVSGRGILPLAWFIATYVILLVVFARPFLLALKRFPKVFLLFVLVWMVLLAMGVDSRIVETKTPNLWLQQYAGYFALGMVLSSVRERLAAKWRIPTLLLLFAGSCVAFFLAVHNAKVSRLPHEYYGEWYYTIWVASMFLLCLELHAPAEWVRKIIARLSANTMVIYLGHLPLLRCVTKWVPIRDLRYVLLYIPATFIVLQLFAELLRRLPLLRKLV